MPTVTVCGAGTSNVTLTEAVPVGDHVVLLILNSAFLSAAGISDGRGNTYQNDTAVQHITVPGLWLIAISSKIGTALQVSDTISTVGQYCVALHVHGLRATGWFETSTFTDRSDSLSRTLNLATAKSRLLIGMVGAWRLSAPPNVTVSITSGGWTVDGALSGSTAAAMEGGHQLATASGNYSIGGSSGNATFVLALIASYLAAPDAWGLSFDRGPDTRLDLAFIDPANALKVNLYNDALPDGVGSTVTVESADAQGCSLTCRRSGVWDLLYVVSDVAKWRVSRDQGATWSVATTIASGYQDVRHCLDEATGILVAALWDETNERWYQSVGVLDSGGTTWSFSTPTILVSSAKRAADIRRRKDGTLEFAYVDTSDAVQIVTCRQISVTTNGTWA